MEKDDINKEELASNEQSNDTMSEQVRDLLELSSDNMTQQKKKSGYSKIVKWVIGLAILGAVIWFTNVLFTMTGIAALLSVLGITATASAAQLFVMVIVALVVVVFVIAFFIGS